MNSLKNRIRSHFWPWTWRKKSKRVVSPQTPLYDSKVETEKTMTIIEHRGTRKNTKRIKYGHKQKNANEINQDMVSVPHRVKKKRHNKACQTDERRPPTRSGHSHYKMKHITRDITPTFKYTETETHNGGIRTKNVDDKIKICKNIKRKPATRCIRRKINDVNQDALESARDITNQAEELVSDSSSTTDLEDITGEAREPEPHRSNTEYQRVRNKYRNKTQIRSKHSKEKIKSNRPNESSNNILFLKSQKKYGNMDSQNDEIKTNTNGTQKEIVMSKFMKLLQDFRDALPSPEDITSKAREPEPISRKTTVPESITGEGPGADSNSCDSAKPTTCTNTTKKPMNFLNRCKREFHAQGISTAHVYAWIKIKRDSEIEAHVDEMRLMEWRAFTRALRHDRTLSKICIKSNSKQRKLNKGIATQTDCVKHNITSQLLTTKFGLTNILKSLRIHIVNNTSLRVMEFVGLRFTDVYLECLCAALRESTIDTLIIKHSLVYDVGCEKICSVLRSENFQHLELVNCHLSSVTGQYIANFIKEHTFIYALGRCKDSLRQSDDDNLIVGIRKLNLSYNYDLGNLGASQIIHALNSDSSLRSLELQSCGLTTDIEYDILKMLKNNSSLYVADFRDNHLNNNTLTKIEEIIINRILRECRYKWTPNLHVVLETKSASYDRSVDDDRSEVQSKTKVKLVRTIAKTNLCTSIGQRSSTKEKIPSKLSASQKNIDQTGGSTMHSSPLLSQNNWSKSCSNLSQSYDDFSVDSNKQHQKNIQTYSVHENSSDVSTVCSEHQNTMPVSPVYFDIPDTSTLHSRGCEMEKPKTLSTDSRFSRSSSYSDISKHSSQKQNFDVWHANTIHSQKATTSPHMITKERSSRTSSTHTHKNEDDKISQNIECDSARENLGPYEKVNLQMNYQRKEILQNLRILRDSLHIALSRKKIHMVHTSRRNSDKRKVENVYGISNENRSGNDHISDRIVEDDNISNLEKDIIRPHDNTTDIGRREGRQEVQLMYTSDAVSASDTSHDFWKESSTCGNIVKQSNGEYADVQSDDSKTLIPQEKSEQLYESSFMDTVIMLMYGDRDIKGIVIKEGNTQDANNQIEYLDNHLDSTDAVNSNEKALTELKSNIVDHRLFSTQDSEPESLIDIIEEQDIIDYIDYMDKIISQLEALPDTQTTDEFIIDFELLREIEEFCWRTGNSLRTHKNGKESHTETKEVVESTPSQGHNSETVSSWDQNSESENENRMVQEQGSRPN